MKRREKIGLAFNPNVVLGALAVDDRAQMTVARDCALDRHSTGIVILRRAFDVQREGHRGRNRSDEPLRRIDPCLRDAHLDEPLR